KKRPSDFIAEASALSSGDIVVHTDHGIGRFIGLRTIEAVGAPHDCLEIHYAGDDRLFLPVENIELLSRYGSDSAEATLDKLGGGAWQSRKARLKRRLLDMAGQLIRIAAERQMRAAPSLVPAEGLYGEFSARFPYEETDDQQTAIDSVMGDLGAGKPMDRLICGDVGFGKTEVALRAAFIAAMEGFQVAVVVPTTLLSRQHFKTFSQRFSGLPIRVAQASRLVGAKDLAETKKGIAEGTVDIVVGTHALLGASISFKNLGLLIIDEEQHFGVKHKERLKDLKSDVHVLTLSATPIPRTLQLALTGVRELSLIATPPVDRLAVRTFISPFDPLVIRETLLRERYRGGHSFYVVPRISDLAEIHDFLRESVPELKVAVAHGQMPPGELDDIMNAFYDGQYDVLLSTTIVESGLDIPTANTLIVHRADMFGLSQLYQLRGRVGRSKVRAYALFTLPANRKLTDTAERRLKVLQSLDTLGAGFQLASHDLDIRGAGNLLGEEQSGHIKEVGFELYQQMLEEAVAEVKDSGEVQDGGWSPQIAVGTAVMIGPGLLAGLGGPVWAKFALVGASLSYAVALMIARRFKGVPSSVIATGQLTASTIIMIPIVLLSHGTANLFSASPPVWAAVLALALLSTAFAYILYFNLVASAGATNASLVTLIVPASAILLGFLFLGERLELFELGGMALIAMGLVTIDGRLFGRQH
ncbi:DEAD/DEAH box helicase, partial [Mesorhizobium sp. M5C.F.Ca.IN.020.14.1.1]